MAENHKKLMWQMKTIFIKWRTFPVYTVITVNFGGKLVEKSTKKFEMYSLKLFRKEPSYEFLPTIWDTLVLGSATEIVPGLFSPRPWCPLAIMSSVTRGWWDKARTDTEMQDQHMIHGHSVTKKISIWSKDTPLEKDQVTSGQGLLLHIFIHCIHIFTRWFIFMLLFRLNLFLSFWSRNKKKKNWNITAKRLLSFVNVFYST